MTGKPSVAQGIGATNRARAMLWLKKTMEPELLVRDILREVL
jgi:hypothetical protein